ncbi:MAG: 30S ribosomal protein S12 methylthiotransferase RimO [Pygmaiobacter massiliensis]|nr:30S ribosomal protein S12 methylthiotransferase RimO [Pygmaiobacter massiliensis]
MKIAMISLGCPKNQVDADVLCHRLLAAGYETTPYPEDADVILVNTCGFIESAKQEAIDNILQAASYKKDGRNPKLVVTGCLAERYRQEIQKEIPEVDATVGIGCNGDIVEILQRALSGEKVEAFGPKTDLSIDEKRVISTPRHYAYLKIAEGCDNRCTYCAIPMIRGPLRSRTIDSLVAEANWLAQEGVKELIVVAQDVTAYGCDLNGGHSLIAPLLDQLQKVEGIRWIRLLYAYPERITDEFIAAMCRNSKVVPYLDLPIQHANSEVLKRMNRKGDRKVVEEAICRLRKAIPNLTLRTTLIAGFPGETQEQFEELCEFVTKTRFDRLGCFAYSAEEDTPAARLPQLPEQLRQERADQIMQLQSRIMEEKQSAKVGSRLLVLCDEQDDETGLYICRSAADAPEIDTVVYVKSDAVPLAQGEFLTVTVTANDVYDLYAEPAKEECSDESAQ